MPPFCSLKREAKKKIRFAKWVKNKCVVQVCNMFWLQQCVRAHLVPESDDEGRGFHNTGPVCATSHQQLLPLLLSRRNMNCQQPKCGSHLWFWHCLLRIDESERCSCEKNTIFPFMRNFWVLAVAWVMLGVVHVFPRWAMPEGSQHQHRDLGILSLSLASCCLSSPVTT